MPTAIAESREKAAGRARRLAEPAFFERNGSAGRLALPRRAMVFVVIFVLSGSAALQAAFIDHASDQTRSFSGGARRVVADFAWLSAYVKWEQQNAAGTEAMLALTTKLDPAPLYFWINGARMIAYDFPQWSHEDSGAAPTDGTAIQARQNYCARRALNFLDRAIAQHPQSALLWIERANIQYARLRDFDGAAESFRAAAVLPGAPYYAGRLHAEMLRRAGRKAEALAWLRELYPKLPHGSEAAAADLVRERIRVLEAELADVR